MLESEEPRFGGDGGSSDGDQSEKEDRLAIVASPPLSETWGTMKDLFALQSNIFPFALSLLLLLICFLTLFSLNIGTLFADIHLLYLHPAMKLRNWQSLTFISCRFIVRNWQVSSHKLVFVVSFNVLICLWKLVTSF